MSQKELGDFVRKARKENEERKAEALAAKGDSPYLNLEEGLNKFMLQPEIPSERESSFGKTQYCFKVTQGGTEKVWTVTKNSPMAQQVVDKLLKAPVELTVNRLGTGKSTRLALLEKKS
jgi:hypothetical protein